MEEVQSDPYEIMGIITYLTIIKKYPETRNDILKLRRQKNKALYISLALTAIFAFLFGYFIAGLTLVF